MDEQPAWGPQTIPPAPGARPPAVRGSVVVVVVALVVVLATAAVLLIGGRSGDEAVPVATTGPHEARLGGLRLPKVPDGFTLFADHDGSFAMVVPDGWETVLLDESAVRRAQDRLRDDHPALAEVVDGLGRSVDAGGLGFAGETTASNGYLSRLELVRSPRSGESLTSIAASAQATLASQGYAVAGTSALTVGDRSALQIDYSVPTPTGAVPGHQLVVLSGYRSYSLTVTGVGSGTARAVVGSLRVP